MRGFENIKSWKGTSTFKYMDTSKYMGSPSLCRDKCIPTRMLRLTHKHNRKQKHTQSNKAKSDECNEILNKAHKKGKAFTTKHKNKGIYYCLEIRRDT